MKVRAAVCMFGFEVVVLVVEVVVVVVVGFESLFCDLVVAGISGRFFCLFLS